MAGIWRVPVPKLNHERLMSEIHVLDAQGKLYAGYSGMRRMLRELPLGLPIWLLLQLPGTEAIGKSLYRFIARRRYRINALLGKELPECADGGCSCCVKVNSTLGAYPITTRERTALVVDSVNENPAVGLNNFPGSCIVVIAGDQYFSDAALASLPDRQFAQQRAKSFSTLRRTYLVTDMPAKQFKALIQVMT